MTNIFNDILFKDKLPEELILSLIVPIFKGKGDPLNPNSYREYCCLNMLLNCRRRIWMGVCVRWYIYIYIYIMQYGFMPGRGTIDTVFVLRRPRKNLSQK